MYLRKQILENRQDESAFLWGPRQTGKSTLLKKIFPAATYFDLLKSDEYERLLRQPSLLREEILASPPQQKEPVIIDEIQKIPPLLDDVQWLMVNKNIRFILCGSSARKLKRTGANLLGGRALRYEMFPLVSSEIPDFNLLTALNNGLVPRHYQGKNPEKMLSAYIGDYLKEEIAAEALTRNVPAFSRFLEAAAFSNGEMVNFNNIATDCAVSSPTVKEYFSILEDTMLARFVPAFVKRPGRRVITSPKFYFFDIGISNYLLKRGEVRMGSESFGRAFEHFIFMELTAYSHYSGKNFPIFYWRTASKIEVDFILGDHETVIEVKSGSHITSKHLKGIKAFKEEYKVNKSIVISGVPKPRLTDEIEILPWQQFLTRLWAGNII